MLLYLINHDYRYAVDQMLATLLPHEKPEYPTLPSDGDRIELALFHGQKLHTAVCSFYQNGVKYMGRASIQKSKTTDEITRARFLQMIVKRSFYRAVMRSGMDKPAWGALTGIRPGKLLSAMLEGGMSDKAATSKFIADNSVSPARARLCLHTAHAGRSCAASLNANDICLYVGIPFCPTRCSYCSFVSQSTHLSMKLIPEFLQALYKEIDATGAIVRDLKLRPIALYLGGGTPTTLSAPQLHELFGHLEAAFDLSSLREITVEAGRPDTITAEKLEALKKHQVTRVSVNPQTMDDAVLDAIGRKHTAQDILDALELVRRASCFQVNMDIIAGLPLDTPVGFQKTLDTVLSLSPENITVHTLALKKGSRITLGDIPRPSSSDVEKMLDYANTALFYEKYEPYYLYRQKYMSGGFENVGWQKSHSENIYNICIMEELCSIISMGGGASTKIKPGDGRIVRMYTPKYPSEYIASIHKIISEKERIRELLCHTI